MQQLGLFDDDELLKRNAEAALKSLRFHEAHYCCKSIAANNIDYDFLDASFDMCRFWTARYGTDADLWGEDPLLFYEGWREFESDLQTKHHAGHPIVRLMKNCAFLNRIGMATITPALRERFGHSSVMLLDLLIEIERWDLALAEAKILLGSSTHFRSSKFFVQCSKTFHRKGWEARSTELLLRAFWDSPDLIYQDDILDEGLRGGFYDIESDYEKEADSVELIPLIILLQRRLSPATMTEHMAELDEGIRKCESARSSSEKSLRLRYRLFCLRAWKVELSGTDDGLLAERRREMKALDGKLFQQYRKKERGQPLTSDTPLLLKERKKPSRESEYAGQNKVSARRERDAVGGQLRGGRRDVGEILKLGFPAIGAFFARGVCV